MKKKRYLINILLYSNIASFCINLILVVFYIFERVKGNNYLSLIFLALLIMMLSALFQSIFLVFNNKVINANINYFLRGYTNANTLKEPKYFTSEAEHKMYKKLCDVLNPTKLFEQNKNEAQFLALQNQINPHFLYNTLESIRSEALMEGVVIVADMTEALATFFRYTISNVENLVSVEDELYNCETYFRIQQYRFGDRLSLEFIVDEKDREKIYGLKMPKLTLQPILENSIIHGTELMMKKGYITISLELTERRLKIQISDNGVGMDEKTLLKLNQKIYDNNSSSGQRNGVALENVNRRIRLLFGDEYGIHIFSLEGIGTDVEISIPIIKSDVQIQNMEALNENRSV